MHMIKAIAVLAWFSMALLPAQTQTSRAEQEMSWLNSRVNSLNWELQQNQEELQHRQSVREMSHIPMPPNCSHMEISLKGRVKFVYDNGKVQTCKFRKVSSTRSAVPLGIVAGSGGEMNAVSESENYQSGIRRERAEFALPDWKPYDTWTDRVGKDGKPIPFTCNDFRRHSDRLRSGRFQGGFLSPRLSGTVYRGHDGRGRRGRPRLSRTVRFGERRISARDDRILQSVREVGTAKTGGAESGLGRCASGGGQEEACCRRGAQVPGTGRQRHTGGHDQQPETDQVNDVCGANFK